MNEFDTILIEFLLLCILTVLAIGLNAIQNRLDKLINLSKPIITNKECKEDKK